MRTTSRGSAGTARTSSAWLDRRAVLAGGAATGAALGTGLGWAYAQSVAPQSAAPDHKLHIAPLRLELAPGHVVDTFAYNGTVPGPLLRLPEGRPVTIDVTNATDIDDIVHWHGLFLPAAADGAMEEGSPMIGQGATQRYS
ncbi:MAG TPA: multicopper oxidase domain-containing protein, partial [Xanthobacteraceae bacterium]